MYGTQTYILESDKTSMFENDVKMYGTQTETRDSVQESRLRMM